MILGTGAQTARIRLFQGGGIPAAALNYSRQLNLPSDRQPEMQQTQIDPENPSIRIADVYTVPKQLDFGSQAW